MKYRLNAVVYFELLVDLVYVVLHRDGTDFENGADLILAFAFGDPAQDLAFTPGQGISQRGRADLAFVAV